jgi:hypothetical protein
MTIEVLDMPDLTELPGETDVPQRTRCLTRKLEWGTTGHVVLPPTARCPSPRVSDPPFYRKRDGSE